MLSLFGSRPLGRASTLGSRARGRASTLCSRGPRIAWLALACAACTADGGEADELEHDAPDAGSEQADAALPAPLERVSNVGASCSLLARNCKGAASQCLEISYTGAFYAGGYCTADCKSSAECGPAGECPVGAAEALDPSYAFRSTWARKCFLGCDPAVPDSCRTGYACRSLAEAYLADDAPAPLHRSVCIPRVPSFGGDAGSLHSLKD